ncbi:cyclic-di-AMP receptor [Erysipelatoclostridium sp. An173]|uniref:cyclic-di-AMP receptor n=1 Tax=Erysipelatoclostridium sp. An173 TaxID=1965571 RepID=UPI003209BD01
MKIMLIVLNEDDGKKIANELEMDDYKVTRLKSLGGFIKDGQIAIINVNIILYKNDHL